MAIVVRGKTTCRLCGRVVQPNDLIVMFPPGSFRRKTHSSRSMTQRCIGGCLLSREYAGEALARLESYTEQTAKGT